MTPKSCSSELSPKSREHQENNNASEITVTTTPAQELLIPSGKCMFITPHKFATEQRCICQGFIRNASLPGAYCHCGHQASYHSNQVNSMSPPRLPTTTSDETCNSPSHATLLDRIHHLESKYAFDRKQWEKELRQERHSRQEDIRALREAMHTFFRFMEKDVPRQFTDLEDKIESLVDDHQRVQEKVISVDDFSMALDDRIIELEQTVFPNKVQGNNDHEGIRQQDKEEIAASHVLPTSLSETKDGFKVPQPKHRPYLQQSDRYASTVKEKTQENDSSLKLLTRVSHSSNAYNTLEGPSTEVQHLYDQRQNHHNDPVSMKRKRSIQAERDSKSNIKVPLPNPPPLLLSD